MQITNNYIKSFFIVIFFIILYSLLSLNLYFIQVKQAPFFQNLADKQYNVTIQSYPQRAEIFDCNQKLVTLNKDSITAFILPKSIFNEHELLLFLQNHFPQAAQQFDHYKHKNFMFIKRNLNQDEINVITNRSIKDIQFLKESSRFYPYQSLGTLIGITDIDNNGLFGIEHQYNNELQGSPTTYNLKKDAKQKHFYFSKQTTQEGITPLPLTLSIDADLQFKCQIILDETISECEASEGAALIIDPDTGEICTMISNPYFDPNNTKELTISHTKNRSITECFEPGSVMKIFAALAALEEKVVTPDEMIDCQNTKETILDGIRIRTVFPNGIISFKDVIKFSNNIGITKIAKRLGHDLYDYYKLFGFATYTGINLAGEQKGFVNHPSHWSAYSIQSLSYGYEIRTTILQLARAFCMIMNGGYLITPTIFKNKAVEKKGPFISQQTIRDLQSILEETVQTGTAHRAKITGYKVIGKTGTANILANGMYDEKKHIFTFVGAIEYNNYKKVIVTYIKESKKFAYASLTVAPLFKKLAETILIHDQIFKEQEGNK